MALKRNFWWMVTGRSVSKMGDTFSFLALMLMIYAKTGSVMSVGQYMISTQLPAILLGPFIGVWVDRLNKRMTAFIGELLRAAVIVSIPFVPDVNDIYLCTFVAALVGAFSKNAQGALIPDLFPRDSLMGYNAKIQTAIEVMGVIGPVVAGIVIGFWSYDVAFFFDAATFVYSAIALLMLSLPKTVEQADADASAAPAEKPSFWAEMAAGAKHLVGMPRVMNALAIMFANMIVGGMFNVLFVVFSKETIGVTDQQYGWLEAALGVGFAAGAFLMNYGKNVDPLTWIRWSAVLDGLLFAQLGTVNNFYTEMIVIVGIGMTSVVAMIAAPTMMQMEAERSYIGRVIGFYQTAFMAGTVISMALAGVVATWFDTRDILIYGGLLIVFAACLFSLKRLPRPVAAGEAENQQSA